jgi:hypothetical protein
MTAPTTPPTAPNRADGAEGSDYATTAPTAPSPLGRGGGDGAVARTTAGSKFTKEGRRGPASAGKRSWDARGVETKSRPQEVATYGGSRNGD